MTEKQGVDSIRHLYAYPNELWLRKKYRVYFGGAQMFWAWWYRNDPDFGRRWEYLQEQKAKRND